MNEVNIAITAQREARLEIGFRFNFGLKRSPLNTFSDPVTKLDVPYCNASTLIVQSTSGVRSTNKEFYFLRFARSYKFNEFSANVMLEGISPIMEMDRQIVRAAKATAQTSRNSRDTSFKTQEVMFQSKLQCLSDMLPLQKDNSFAAEEAR